MNRRILACVLLLLAAPAIAQTNLAEGFRKLPAGSRIALMPVDVELFQISAGGVLEPRADWTTAAAGHLKAAYRQHMAKLGARVVEPAEEESDAMAGLKGLHAAVSAAISLHHFGSHPLPTKEKKLDWTLGPDVRLIREKAGADYALFTFVRDSYATRERVASVVVALALGIAMPPGGVQVGYASLVDLASGRIVWFNQMLRSFGDLREGERAVETVQVLLEGFPE